MSGSPPQIDTIGACIPSSAPRQSSRVIMSLMEVEYSRIRPSRAGQVARMEGLELQDVANFSVRRSLLPMMYAAILVVSASGNLIRGG
jgi:hypothetical protein